MRRLLFASSFIGLVLACAAFAACGSDDPAPGSPSIDGGPLPDATDFDVGRIDTGPPIDSGGVPDSAPDAAVPVEYVDITAGQGQGMANQPWPMVDAVNQKLLVAAHTDAMKPVLFRCNLDGTGCTFHDISAGQPDMSGVSVSGVVDAVNAKVLVVSVNEANDGKTSLFRCDLDGTACTHTDISAGAGRIYFGNPLIDTTAQKLLVTGSNQADADKLTLLRCDLDGTGCTVTDISNGKSGNIANNPSALVDPVNQKLLVVTSNGVAGYKPWLFRCALDGTACTDTDVSAGVNQDTDAGFVQSTEPSALIDPTAQKLLIVTKNQANGFRSGLVRCNVDGTGCAMTDISAGQPERTGASPSAVLDPVAQKLLVVTIDNDDRARLPFVRCALDGTGCLQTNIAAGRPAISMYVPKAVLDPTPGSRRLLVVASDSSTVGLALFRVTLP